MADPISWLQDQISRLAGYRGVPFSARSTFRVELPAMIAWAVGGAAVEGSFAGFVAAKALNAPDWLVAVIGASGAFAHLLAIVWSSFSAGKDRRMMVAVPLAAVAALLFSVYFTPAVGGLHPAWVSLPAVVFAVQVAGALAFFAFANTIRSSLWRVNYPASFRGQILARFTLWQMLVSSLCILAFGYLMDHAVRDGWLGGQTAFRYLMPVGGLAALACAGLYLVMPTKQGPYRSRAESLRPELLQTAVNITPMSQEEVESELAGEKSGFWNQLRLTWQILREDKLYRKYQFWQMVQGGGMLMVEVPLVLILKNRFQSDYADAAWALVFIPRITMALTTSWWARVFDRIDVWRYRAQQSRWLLAARLFLCLGALFVCWPLMLIGLTIHGVGISGGNLAWQLGHMQFGRKDRDSLYMGIHVTLTGVRGVVMPFLGTWLYSIPWIDWNVLWLSATMLMISTTGFNLNSKRESQRLTARQKKEAAEENTV